MCILQSDVCSGTYTKIRHYSVTWLRQSLPYIFLTPRAQRTAFQEGLVASFNSVMDALVRVRGERAEAFKESDKEMIFKAIEDTIGFNVLNEKVIDQLRSWYLRTGIEVTEEMEALGKGETQEFGGLCFNLGEALRQLGDYPRALSFYEKVLKIFLKTVGEVLDMCILQSDVCSGTYTKIRHYSVTWLRQSLPYIFLTGYGPSTLPLRATLCELDPPGSIPIPELR